MCRARRRVVKSRDARRRRKKKLGLRVRGTRGRPSAEQKTVAESVIAKVNASGAYDSPVVTAIEEGKSFTPAEGYHQDYLQANPNGYTCHFMRDVSF